MPTPRTFLTCLACCATATMAASAPAPASAPDPALNAVGEFYRVYHRAKIDGLPSAKQLLKIRLLLSPRLTALVERARAEQLRCYRRHPHDKPPWTEGDLFSSGFEGFTAFETVAPAHDENGRKVVDVAFTGPGEAHWLDRVVLVPQRNRWLVDDVEYRGTQAFTSGYGKALSQALTAIPAC